MSAGDAHVCALDADGHGVCWGPSLAAGGVIVTGPRFTSITAGIDIACPERGECAEPPAMHACAIAIDARAWCWGDNRFGQLGDGTTIDRREPVAVAGALRFESIRAGRGYTCGIADATAWCWGYNGKANLGIGGARGAYPRPQLVARRARAVEAAADFACALDSDGLAYCWGEDYHGRLGSDAATGGGTTPLPVPVNGVARYIALSARGNHTCGITAAGTAWCWGSNVDGQLGADPAQVRARRDPGDSGTPPLLAITAGHGGHTCGVARDARAWCWGRNNDGELGTGTSSAMSCFADPCIPRPTPVAGDLRFRSLSAGDAFTCGVTVAGELLCWGRLSWTHARVPTPVRFRPIRAQRDASRDDARIDHASLRSIHHNPNVREK